MNYTVVSLNHYHAKNEEWGDQFALHRKGCPETSKTFYNVEYTHDVNSIEDAVLFCFGDFIGEHKEDMSVEDASLYLKKCSCTDKDANYCNVSKCKHCSKQIYDLENAVWTEWYSDDDCGCERGD